MALIENTIEIGRPPDVVFGYVTDLAAFPQWQQDVVSVEVEGDGPAAVGTRFRTARRIGGAVRTTVQEITELDGPWRFAARGVEGILRPYATVTVEPLDGGARSRVTFGLDFEGHGAGIPLVPAVRRMAAKGAPVSHRQAKHLLETGEAP